MCCSHWFRLTGGQSAEEKLSVRDRSSAPQPITGSDLLWTLRRILRASSAAESNRRVFIFCLIPARDSEQHLRGWFLQQMCDRYTEGETKIICSCVFWGSVEKFTGFRQNAHNTLSAERWEGKCVSGNGHTGGWKGSVEGLYVPPQNKRCTLRQRREVCGPDLNVQQGPKPVCIYSDGAKYFFNTWRKKVYPKWVFIPIYVCLKNKQTQTQTKSKTS